MTTSALKKAKNKLWALGRPRHAGDPQLEVRRWLGLAAFVSAVSLLTTCGESQGPGKPPEIVLSATSVTFSGVELGANPPNQTVNVSNAGDGALAWTATASAPWLAATPSSGTGVGTVTLTANTTGLAAGSHSATVTIASVGASNSPRTVSVALTLEMAPRVAHSPDSLIFVATALGIAPPNIQLQLSNAGGSTLTWGAAPTTTWLTVAPTNGTGPATVTVGVNPAYLQLPGTFNGQITVVAPGASNSPKSIPVKCIVLPQSLIGLSASIVSRSLVPGDSTTGKIAIRNDGGGTLNWTATARSTWLRPTPSGTAPDSLTYRLSAANLTLGSYSDTITITAAGAGNSPQKVRVNLTVQPPLLVSSFDEGFQLPPNDTLSRKISIREMSGSTLAWTASNSASWLAVSPASGSTPDSLKLSVNSQSLSSGTRTDTVLITAPAASNSPLRILVYLNVRPPQIYVQTFVSKTMPPNDTLTQGLVVLNLGLGTLTWTATNNASWLHLPKASGGAPDTISLKFNTQGLADATYRDTVVVTSPGAVNTPQKIEVWLTVKRPQIMLSPSALTFDISQGQSTALGQDIYLYNSGTGTFDWTATKAAPWLSIAPTSGSAAANQASIKIRATVDTTGRYVPGTTQTYRDTVLISAVMASNTPQKVPVTLILSPPPAISVLDTPVVVAAQGGTSTAVSKAFRVANAGGGTLTWSATHDASWLTLSPVSGSTTVAYPWTVTASANPTGMSVGTYSTTVTIAAPGATNTPRTMPVTFVVAPIYDGAWSGLTGIDSTITFQISNNRITTITVGLGGIPNSCGGTVSGRRTHTVSIDVNAGTFSRFVRTVYADAFGFPTGQDVLYYTITGTFSSATAASGSITMGYSSGSCGGTRTTTWTATRP